MNSPLKSLVLACTAAFAGACSAYTIDTTNSGPYGTMGLFGAFNTATVGQTFTATSSGSRLGSLSFRIEDHWNQDVVRFAAYVYAWDGAKATGPRLWASTEMATTDNHGAGGFERFDFDTGGIDLAVGQQYVAFLSVSEFYNGLASGGLMDYTAGDKYSGGNVVFTNNDNDFGRLTTQAWDCGNGCVMGWDLWFRAEFGGVAAEVPEPSTWSLMLAGVGMAAVARRRAVAQRSRG